MDEGYRPHHSTVIMVSLRQYGEHACGRFPYSSANTVNPMLERRSLKAPIALGVVMIVLVVTTVAFVLSSAIVFPEIARLFSP